VSFVTWLFFEIFVLLVPLFVLADVMKMKEKALVDLMLLREKCSQTTSDGQNGTSPATEEGRPKKAPRLGRFGNRMFSLWNSDSESSINFDPRLSSEDQSLAEEGNHRENSSSSSVSVSSSSVHSSDSGIINLSTQKGGVAKVEVEGWRLVDDRSFNPRLFLEGLIKGGGREGGRKSISREYS
jgi:hypothetical protein